MVLNIAALTACASRHSPLTDGRRGTGDGGRKGGCFHGKVAVPPPSSVRPSLHLMIVVATAVVTVVVSAVVTAERSKARVSRSALNYVPSGRAREGGSRGNGGAARWKERDTRKGERTRATATDDCSLRERRTDGMRRRGGGGRRARARQERGKLSRRMCSRNVGRKRNLPPCRRRRQ